MRIYINFYVFSFTVFILSDIDPTLELLPYLLFCERY